MGCSFPLAEIKFFIYIKNAGLEGKERKILAWTKAEWAEGRSDPSSSPLFPTHCRREQDWPQLWVRQRPSLSNIQQCHLWLGNTAKPNRVL